VHPSAPAGELTHFLLGSFPPGSYSETIQQENDWNRDMLMNPSLHFLSNNEVNGQCHLLHPSQSITIKPGPLGLGWYGAPSFSQMWNLFQLENASFAAYIASQSNGPHDEFVVK